VRHADQVELLLDAHLPDHVHLLACTPPHHHTFRISDRVRLYGEYQQKAGRRKRGRLPTCGLEVLLLQVGRGREAARENLLVLLSRPQGSVGQGLVPCKKQRLYGLLCSCLYGLLY
jgi:hypothetical protein